MDEGLPGAVMEDDMREMAKTTAWSVSSCKPSNGVASIRDDSLDTYWNGVLRLFYSCMSTARGLRSDRSSGSSYSVGARFSDGRVRRKT